jgi:hypothetical protein
MDGWLDRPRQTKYTRKKGGEKRDSEIIEEVNQERKRFGTKWEANHKKDWHNARNIENGGY